MCPKTSHFAILLFVWLLTMTAPAKAAEPQIHKGTVVSATAERLTIKDRSGREQTHLVSKETKVTINGQPGRLENLKPTTLVQVTTEGGDKVVSIATIDNDKLPLTAS